jgi:hypothetical protein
MNDYDEEWKTIKEYPRYQVSTKGILRLKFEKILYNNNNNG